MSKEEDTNMLCLQDKGVGMANVHFIASHSHPYN